MAKPKNKKGKRSKASVKVQDMKPSRNPKGGRKAGGGQQDYLIYKMTDVKVES